VLPLGEDPTSGEEDLFKMEDIKLEVMRARGAGGQVCFYVLPAENHAELRYSTSIKRNRLYG
jgi:hypothetical protein